VERSLIKDYALWVMTYCAVILASNYKRNRDERNRESFL